MTTQQMTREQAEDVLRERRKEYVEIARLYGEGERTVRAVECRETIAALDFALSHLTEAGAGEAVVWQTRNKNTGEWFVPCARCDSNEGINNTREFRPLFAHPAQEWQAMARDANDALDELADAIKGLSPTCCNSSFPVNAARRNIDTIRAALAPAAPKDSESQS